MKFLQFRTLNSHGIAHFLLPLLIIVVVALTGAYMVVSSNANPARPACNTAAGYVRDSKSGQCVKQPTCNSAAGYSYDAKTNQCINKQACNAAAGYVRDSKSGQCVKGTVKPTCNTSAGYSYDAKTNQCINRPACNTAAGYVRDSKSGQCVKKVTTLQKKAAQKQSNDDGNSGSQTAQKTVSPTPTGTNQPAQSVPYTSNVSAELKPYVRKTGNIVVVTYFDDTDAKGVRNGVLGNVKVTVEKVGGSLKCNPSAKGTRLTNAKKNAQGKPTENTGKVHFNNCDVGQYKATLVGRNNYVPATNEATIKTFTLSENETQIVPFVMKKGSTGP